MPSRTPRPDLPAVKELRHKLLDKAPLPAGKPVLRVGVSQQLVVRALSRATGVDEGVIAHRLSGTWIPRAESFTALMAAETSDADVSRPYPFFLAYPLEDDLEAEQEVPRVVAVGPLLGVWARKPG